MRRATNGCFDGEFRSSTTPTVGVTDSSEATPGKGAGARPVLVASGFDPVLRPAALHVHIVRQLSGVFKGSDNAFAKLGEGCLDALRLGGVLGIEHAADDGFADAEVAGEVGVTEAGFLHGEVDGEFGGKGERDADGVLAALGGGGLGMPSPREIRPARALARQSLAWSLASARVVPLVRASEAGKPTWSRSYGS